MSKDAHDLKTLAVAHIVWGGINALGGLFAFAVMAPHEPALRWFLVLGIVWSVPLTASGFFLYNRRWRWFSILIAALCCPVFPIGTGLGIATLVILRRRSVIEAYRTSEESGRA